MSIALAGSARVAPRIADIDAIVRNAVARIVVYDNLAHAEPAWRRFERVASATPYQRFDWVSAFMATIGEAEQDRIAVGIGLDTRGKPTILLPLAIRHVRGFNIASVVGGKHANFCMPLFAPDDFAGPDALAASRFLALLARRIGQVDAFVFTNQPRAWQSAANPFAPLGGRPSPSDGYKVDLDFDAEAAAQRLLSGETRKKFRQKEQRLAAMGALSFSRAATPAEADAVLAAFFAQKAARLRQIGVPNPFVEPTVEAFLRRGSITGIGDGSPAIELYALRVGERIIATFGGASDGRRFCGMFHSFDMEPGIARCSPGDLLILRVIRAQCERGLATFDLGVGEAPYKTMFCNRTEELLDTCIPMTAKGAAYAAAASSLCAAKRAIKRSPLAWRLARFAQARAVSVVA